MFDLSLLDKQRLQIYNDIDKSLDINDAISNKSIK